MSKLTLHTLQAEFVKLVDERGSFVRTQDFAAAQGLFLLCPVCFVQNKGDIGTHMILCWSRSRGVPDDISPGPGRWMLQGTSLMDLTLNGDVLPGGGVGSRSVHLSTSACKAHFFVDEGLITSAMGDAIPS